jgi:hypothetical protein
MNAMIRIGPVHRGHMSGSTLSTCLISHAQARFAAEAETSVNSSMVAGSSPWAFRRLPRLTLLYQP